MNYLRLLYKRCRWIYLSHYLLKWRIIPIPASNAANQITAIFAYKRLIVSDTLPIEIHISITVDQLVCKAFKKLKAQLSLQFLLRVILSFSC